MPAPWLTALSPPPPFLPVTKNTRNKPHSAELCLLSAGWGYRAGSGRAQGRAKGREEGGPGMAEVLEFRVPAGSAQTLLVWGLEPTVGLEVGMGSGSGSGPGPGDGDGVEA